MYYEYFRVNWVKRNSHILNLSITAKKKKKLTAMIKIKTLKSPLIMGRSIEFLYSFVLTIH